MANFRRTKSSHYARCTLCTPYKWLGNSKERVKPKDRPQPLKTLMVE